jgi:hypothetical protein
MGYDDCSGRGGLLNSSFYGEVIAGVGPFWESADIA